MLDVDSLTRLADQHLQDADEALRRDYPGERPGRQPVHTVYVPADRVHAGIVAEYGAAALKALDDHEPDFRKVTGADDDLVARVREKLRREPIEDLRVDFEDGYGLRPDPEETLDARRSARALRELMVTDGSLRGGGIRVRSLEPATRRRSLQTLANFLEGLGDVPDGFVVTLPKVTSVAQVEAMVQVLAKTEKAFAFSEESLHFEIQVETPQSVLGPDGTALVARMIHASQGRCVGLHYGTYDYSASLGIGAEDQSLEHPAADHAKAVMQTAAAGTGVRLSDGSTNILPVGPAPLVRAGWLLHHRLVTRSLHRGYYQGWDLHPAQLPTRFAANFAFYREGFARAGYRLRDYYEHVTGTVMDEPATAVALANFVLRGVDCGAVDLSEALTATGIDEAELAALARRPSQRER